MRAAINESFIDNMPADRDESRIYASVSAYLSLKHPCKIYQELGLLVVQNYVNKSKGSFNEN